MSQQCANAVLREKSSLRIVSCNIALIQSLNVSSGYFCSAQFGNSSYWYNFDEICDTAPLSCPTAEALNFVLF